MKRDILRFNANSIFQINDIIMLAYQTQFLFKMLNGVTFSYN